MGVRPVTTRDVVQSAYHPRPLTLDFHARKERFAVIVAHRRFGKTIACINDLIDKAAQNTLLFPRYAYIAPLYKQAKDVAWTYLKHYAAPITEKVMESELSIVLKNGALIRLYGADNPDALRGVYFDGVIIDEFGQVDPRLFGEVIAPTLTDRQGWVVFIGTPAGQNHFKEVWDGAQSNPAWFARMYKATETGIISDEELELLRSMPGSDENTYRQEMLCDFTAAIRGSFYGDQLAGLPQNQGIFPMDPDRVVLSAWDIGYTDDTSIWFFQSDGAMLRVIDFFSESGLSVEEVMDELRAKPYKLNLCYLPHDAKNKSFQTGKSTLELMRSGGLKVQLVPNLSVQDGIQAVRKTLPSVQFNTGNEEVRRGLNALKNYQREWDGAKKLFKQKPLHDWTSNPADAMRMLALAMTPAASRKGATVIPSTRPPAQSAQITLEGLYKARAEKQRSRRF